jgi:hypothetical protein
MRLAPGEGQLVPTLALRAADDADGRPRGFEDRPLLDVRF